MQKWILSMCMGLAVFTGCKKETPYTSSLSNDISAEGDYIKFRMLNRDVVFSNNSQGKTDSLYAIYYNGVSDSTLTNGSKLYALAVAGYHSKDTGEAYLIIEGYATVTTGKYDFVNATALSSSNGLAQPKFFGMAYTISNRLAYGFIDNTQTTGYTQITKFDLINKIIEGNFVQNNCAAYDGNNNILVRGFNITNGAFSIKNMLVINQSDYDKKYKNMSYHNVQIPKLSALVNKF